ALAPTELHISWDVTLTSEQDRSAIDDVFIFVLDDMELSVEEIDASAAATAAPVEEKAAPAPVAAASAAPVSPTTVAEFRPVEA
ncbi:chemotaxis protein CheA, partial [Mesorhizobium sp. M1A.T.Ca.IN.004.03.1.1]